MAKADETGASGLMQRFMNGNYNFTHRINHQQLQQQSEGEETEEIELSLGLSLNGRFGVDPTRAKKLARSSSIPDFINDAIAKDKNDTVFAMPVGCSNLIRTCSLPTETEEEWVKRKELQTLRRMEAKRKRSEKQKNLRIARDRVRVSGEENNNGEEDRRENAGNVIVNSLPPSWVNGGKGMVFKGGGGSDGRLPPVATQGSNGSSQGTGSSGVSELESQPTQALKKCTGAVSPPSLDSTPRSENKSPITTEVATAEKPGNNIVRVGRERVPASSRVADYGVEAVMTDVLDAMPSVSTRGDGPNGRRIEGFLYRYKKGEEVRIVCVCHGQFLSPAQFVKHAGGGDVEHPLKHIVVNPSPYL